MLPLVRPAARAWGRRRGAPGRTAGPARASTRCGPGRPARPARCARRCATSRANGPAVATSHCGLEPRWPRMVALMAMLTRAKNLRGSGAGSCVSSPARTGGRGAPPPPPTGLHAKPRATCVHVKLQPWGPRAMALGGQTAWPWELPAVPLAGPPDQPGPRAAPGQTGSPLMGQKARCPWPDRGSGQGHHALRPWWVRSPGQVCKARCHWPDQRPGRGHTTLRP